MTQEEKAKAYDEALEDMRVIYPNLKNDVKLAVEHAFPELKESKDERIRKNIVFILNEYSRMSEEQGFLCNKSVINDALAYLEKQKDEAQRQFNLGVQAGREEALYEMEKQKEQKPAMIQWTGKNLKEVINFTGKSPRFGEWFKSWDDFENYVHAHNDILKLFCEDGSHYEVPVGAWIVKTPDGFNIPSLFRFVQKSAEWSEEAQTIIDCAVEIVEKAGLPSLAASLKSLRPQSHWKPSEKQMEALFAASERNDKLGAILNSLYNELKKL